MRKKVRGICLIVVGLAMVCVGMGMFAMYDYQDEIAGRNAEILLAEMASRGTLPEAPLPEFKPALSNLAETPEEELEEVTEEMPVQTYGGYELVGTLHVPSVGIELPVLNDWSYDLLKVAPCRYSGTVAENDLILMGHNYKSHFTPLKKVKMGASVDFVGADGVVYRYEVAEMEIIHKTEVEELPSLEHDLTLFTCTNGGQRRCVVRCVRISEENE